MSRAKVGTRRKNPPAPTVSRTTGYCSICPSLDGVEVVQVEHREADKNTAGVPMYYRICIRCARLVGEAAEPKVTLMHGGAAPAVTS